MPGRHSSPATAETFPTSGTAANTSTKKSK
jgi:hypothetical protein